MIVFLGLALLLMLVDFGLRTPIGFIGAGLAIFSFVIGLVMTFFRIFATIQESAEVKYGYTTLPHLHQDVEERDWRTRRIIRAAGESLLSKEERTARLAGTSQVLVDPSLSSFLCKLGRFFSWL